MIYELYGLPGSGKSTCCDRVQKQCNIKNQLEFYIYNIIGKIFFKLFLKFFKFNKDLKNKFEEIFKILNNSNDYKNSLNLEIKLDLYIKYLIFIYYIEKKSKKTLIIDEGIIHYCLALYAEFNVELEKIDRIISVLKESNLKITIGLKCPVETAILQIKKRNRKRTAMDFLEDKDLENLLNRYFEAIKHFQNNYLYLSIDEIESYIKKGEINEI